MKSNFLVKAENLWKSYEIRISLFKKLRFWALKEVSLEIRQGETVVLLGESGCGKTTLGKLILGIERPDKGNIEVSTFVQAVFQDPYASLNPRMKIKESLLEPFFLKIKKDPKEGLKIAISLLKEVGLSEEVLELYPHALSGGQRQRVALARALITNPGLLVLDEPTSSLDVSVEAQILRVLKKLKKKTKVSYLLITHSLPVAKALGDRILVMYMGKIVEEFSAELLNKTIHHPYTHMLIKAYPDPFAPSPPPFDQIKGEVAGITEIKKGCPFYSRCPIREKICLSKSPKLKALSPNHYIACFLIDKLNNLN